jgi:hypothetical protein
MHAAFVQLGQNLRQKLWFGPKTLCFDPTTLHKNTFFFSEKPYIVIVGGKHFKSTYILPKINTETKRLVKDKAVKNLQCMYILIFSFLKPIVFT